MNTYLKEFTENISEYSNDNLQLNDYNTYQNSKSKQEQGTDIYRTPPKLVKASQLKQDSQSDDSRESGKGSCKSKHSSQNSNFWKRNYKSIIVKLTEEDKKVMNSSVKEIIKNRRKTEDSLKKLEHRRFERMIQSQGTKNHSLICSSNKRLIVNGKIIKPLENNENLWDIEINENDEIIEDPQEMKSPLQFQTQRVSEQSFKTPFFKMSSLQKYGRY